MLCLQRLMPTVCLKEILVQENNLECGTNLFLFWTLHLPESFLVQPAAASKSKHDTFVAGSGRSHRCHSRCAVRTCCRVSNILPVFWVVSLKYCSALRLQRLQWAWQQWAWQCAWQRLIICAWGMSQTKRACIETKTQKTSWISRFYSHFKNAVNWTLKWQWKWETKSNGTPINSWCLVWFGLGLLFVCFWVLVFLVGWLFCCYCLGFCGFAWFFFIFSFFLLFGGRQEESPMAKYHCPEKIWGRDGKNRQIVKILLAV